MSCDINHLIWIDLEMTGLDTQCDHIIEIATIITDSSLRIIAEGPALSIYQPDTVLDAMDEWNTRQHNTSGLVERIRNSELSMHGAEQQTLAFVRQYVPKGKSPMCGSSICQDRRFLARQMPELEAYFHYRNLDVSSVKELVLRWAPSIAKGMTKQSKHLALDDIRDSINELVYYRQHVFRI